MTQREAQYPQLWRFRSTDSRDFRFLVVLGRSQNPDYLLCSFADPNNSALLAEDGTVLTPEAVLLGVARPECPLSAGKIRRADLAWACNEAWSACYEAGLMTTRPRTKKCSRIWQDAFAAALGLEIAEDGAPW